MLIRYFAGAAHAAKQRTQVVDADDITAAALMDQLGANNEELAKVLSVSTLLADGQRVADRQTSLAGIEQLDVLPPFAGG